MAISSEIRELVEILNDEGFGFIAAEILDEVEFTDNEDANAGSADEPDILEADLFSDVGEFITLDNGDRVERAYFDHAIERHEPRRRDVVAEDGQFALALSIIRNRLVFPLRAFAEAEEIANEIQSSPEPERSDIEHRHAPILSVEDEPERPPQRLRLSFRDSGVDLPPSARVDLRFEAGELDGILNSLVRSA